jgi:hypothetical protein
MMPAWQWEQTGNICIEYRQRDQPSGIAATKADVWVHEIAPRRANPVLADVSD